ncbi:MAG: serine/threonine protein kinase [bacterium]|nr:serine/threonine protein kinase [bacterium]
MTSQQSSRVREIVLAAAGLAADEREDYLRSHADEDPEMLAEVRRRIALADEAPDDFLSWDEHDPEETLPDSASLYAETFSKWDRYEVGELLGTGGMGEVFKAFDPRLKRDVALKFLRRADRKTTRRFLREAEAQARVEHEHVLHVHETGELEGRPYIALQYVDGRPLIELRAETTLEEKVQILIAVAEGLHAAHRQGLVHRDVKPSNILVESGDDGRLEPWVMDFGLARPTADPGLTASGVLMGTPHFMAPEQVESRPDLLDRRTDVYGLGATAYRFLSGALLFPSESTLEVLTRVREEEPTPLRERDSALPSELEAIVMKCLEKDPERRYPSARALAEDFRRYLDGEPVEARTSTMAYRLAKKLVRHKQLVTLSAVAAVLLVALLTVFAFTSRAQSRMIAREAERANREAERANREADASSQISSFLIDLFRVSDPGDGNEITAREILDRGAETIEENLADQPLLQAQLMDTIGTVYLGLGLYEPAAHMLEQGLELAREHSTDRDEMVSLMDDLAGLYADHAEIERFEPLYHEALRLLEAADRTPGDLGHSLDHLAALYADRGDFPRAKSLLESSLDLRMRALGEMNPEVAFSGLRLAELHTDVGELERAEELFRASLEVLQMTVGGTEPAAARAEWSLGLVLLARGAAPEAEERTLRALDILTRAGIKGSEMAALHADLTRLYLDTGDLERATEHGSQAMAEATRYATAHPESQAGQWRVAAARLAFGEALAAAGQRADATGWWEAGLDTITPLADEPGSVLAADLRARLLLRLDRVEEARPVVENLLATGWRRPPLVEISRQAGFS